MTGWKGAAAALVMAIGLAGSPVATAAQETEPPMWRRWAFAAAGALATGLPTLLFDNISDAAGCSSTACTTALTAAAGGAVGFLLGRSHDRRVLEQWRLGPDLRHSAETRELRFPPVRLLPQEGGGAVVLGGGRLAALTPALDVVAGGSGIAGLNSAAILPDRSALVATSREGVFSFVLEDDTVRLGLALLPMRASAAGLLDPGTLIVGTDRQIWRLGLGGEPLEAAIQANAPTHGRVRSVRSVGGRILWTIEGDALVARDPRTLEEIGVLEIPGAHALATDGHHAVVRTSDAEMALVDVTAPAAPRVVATIRLGRVERVTGATVFGERLYIAAGPDGLVVYDLAAPAGPERLGVVRGIGDADDVVLSSGGNVLVLDREAREVRRLRVF